MSYLNTELMKTLLQNGSVDEFFRQQLESTINELFQAELTAFLGYEKHSSDGWGSGTAVMVFTLECLKRNTENSIFVSQGIAKGSLNNT